MCAMVNTKHLIDAQGVARLLHLSHPNSVSTYQRRYPDMPRPVLDLGDGRPRLWLRPEIQQWLKVRDQGLPPGGASRMERSAR